MSKKSSPDAILNSLARFSRTHGDLLFLFALLLVLAYAAQLFYQFLYPPIFIAPVPRSREAIFNRPLFQKVIERIESREQRLTEELFTIPRNPFLPRDGAEK